MTGFQLLAFCVLCAVTLARAGPREAREPHLGSDSRPGATCHHHLISCYLDSMDKYQTHNVNQTLSAIHQAGFTQVCQDVGNAVSCARQVLLLEDCTHLQNHMIKHSEALIALGEYVCQYRRYEVSHHFDCLLDPELFARISWCVYNTKTENACDFEPMAQCASGVVEFSTNHCQTGADSLVYVLVMQLPTLGPCGSSA